MHYRTSQANRLPNYHWRHIARTIKPDWQNSVSNQSIRRTINAYKLHWLHAERRPPSPLNEKAWQALVSQSPPVQYRKQKQLTKQKLNGKQNTPNETKNTPPPIIIIIIIIIIVQELCESRGGRPGLSVLTSLLVSVDIKNYWTVLRHWSQLVPNMSTDIWGH